MGMAAGAGIPADVGEPLDSVLTKQPDQLVKVSGRVADGPDLHGEWIILNKRRWTAVADFWS